MGIGPEFSQVHGETMNRGPLYICDFATYTHTDHIHLEHFLEPHTKTLTGLRNMYICLCNSIDMFPTIFLKNQIFIICKKNKINHTYFFFYAKELV